MKPKLYTIGYQKISFDRLRNIAESLKATVIDCRTNPISRKTDFNKLLLHRRLRDRYECPAVEKVLRLCRALHQPRREAEANHQAHRTNPKLRGGHARGQENHGATRRLHGGAQEPALKRFPFFGFQKQK